MGREASRRDGVQILHRMDIDLVGLFDRVGGQELLSLQEK